MPRTLEDTRGRVDEAIQKYGTQISQHLDGAGPTFEVDWDSFENANNTDRVWSHLTSWTGWYTFGYMEDVSLASMCCSVFSKIELELARLSVFRLSATW